MKKLTLLLAGLIIDSNVWAETINVFEVEPINCIAALSIGRDAAEITGNNELFRLPTDVQNNIYLLLPDFPKYSLIQSKKSAIGSKSTELVLACADKY